MKIYARYGLNDFVICLGYKGYVIKEFFANYCLHAPTSPSISPRTQSRRMPHERPRTGV